MTLNTKFLATKIKHFQSKWFWILATFKMSTFSSFFFHSLRVGKKSRYWNPPRMIVVFVYSPSFIWHPVFISVWLVPSVGSSKVMVSLEGWTRHYSLMVVNIPALLTLAKILHEIWKFVSLSQPRYQNCVFFIGSSTVRMMKFDKLRFGLDYSM